MNNPWAVAALLGVSALVLIAAILIDPFSPEVSPSRQAKLVALAVAGFVATYIFFAFSDR